MLNSKDRILQYMQYKDEILLQILGVSIFSLGDYIDIAETPMDLLDDRIDKFRKDFTAMQQDGVRYSILSREACPFCYMFSCEKSVTQPGYSCPYGERHGECVSPSNPRGENTYQTLSKLALEKTGTTSPMFTKEQLKNIIDIFSDAFFGKSYTPKGDTITTANINLKTLEQAKGMLINKAEKVRGKYWYDFYPKRNHPQNEPIFAENEHNSIYVLIPIPFQDTTNFRWLNIKTGRYTAFVYSSPEIAINEYTHRGYNIFTGSLSVKNAKRL